MDGLTTIADTIYERRKRDASIQGPGVVNDKKEDHTGVDEISRVLRFVQAYDFGN